MKNRKVLFVTASLEGGGAERVAQTILELLLQKNIPVVPVLFGEASESKSGSGMDIRYLGFHKRGNLFYTVWKFIKIVFDLSVIIRKENQAVILSFMDYANIVSIAGRWLARAKSGVVVSVHAPPTFQIGERAANMKERLVGMLAKKLYDRADAIIAVSEGIRNDLVQNFGVDKELIHIIHNPVDIDKIRALSDEEVTESLFGEGRPIILSAGRLSKEKGFEYLLKAFCLLKSECDARLVILGKGEEEQRLKKMSADMGIDKKVHFLGFKENPYKYMKRSTIFALSSLYEGFGLVLVEAMVCGAPVVATKSPGGVEEIVEHGKTGLLVPPADEKALAEAILTLLNNESLRKRLSAGGIKKAEDFRVEQAVKQYEDVMESVCIGMSEGDRSE